MPRIELYPYRFRNPVTGKWVRARYVAERHVIAERHAPGDWEIIGPPEIRGVDPHEDYFNPWSNPRPVTAQVKDPRSNKSPAQRDPPSKECPIREPKQIGAQLFEHDPQLMN